MIDIDSLEEAEVKIPADEAFWKEINSHPLFMSPDELMKSDSENLKALQALKYESQDPNANASSYKEEGNYHYNKKEFKIAINCYTKGLLAKPSDKNIACQLLTNRGICNFYLKNYGKSIEDCKFALRFNPNHLKACIKGAQSADILKKPEVALDFAEKGLNIDMNSIELLNIQFKALKLQAQAKSQKDDIKCKQNKLLFEAVVRRGINIDFKMDPILVPQGLEAKLYSDSQGRFHWPVLLMYPEFGQTDFMVDVPEDTHLINILATFFDPESEPPEWNRNRLYRSDDGSLKIYYEEFKQFGSYSKANKNWTIDQLTKRPQ